MSNELLLVFDESYLTNRKGMATRNAIVIDYICLDTCTRILECFLDVLDI